MTGIRLTLHPLRILRFVYMTAKEYYRNDYMHLAAGLTYYGLFSFAPLALVIITIGGILYTKERVQLELLGVVGHYVGSGPQGLLADMMQHVANNPYTHFSAIFGGLLLCYAATTLFVHVQRALTTIYNAEPGYESVAHSVVATRLIAILLMIVLTILFFVLVFVNIGIGIFSEFTSHIFNAAISLVTLHALNFFVTFFMVSVVCAVLYRVFSYGVISWGRAFIGSSLAAFFFIIVNYFLSIYASYVSLNALSGIASSVAVVLLWLYSMVNIFLFGAFAARRKRAA